MKKVLTITCHQVYNYGATLQQYALLEVLKELGYNAKTINYNPPYLSNHFKLWTVPHTYPKNLFLKLAYISLKLPRRILSFKRKKVSIHSKINIFQFCLKITAVMKN